MKDFMWSFTFLQVLIVVFKKSYHLDLDSDPTLEIMSRLFLPKAYHFEKFLTFITEVNSESNSWGSQSSWTFTRFAWFFKFRPTIRSNLIDRTNGSSDGPENLWLVDFLYCLGFFYYEILAVIKSNKHLFKCAPPDDLSTDQLSSQEVDVLVDTAKIPPLICSLKCSTLR